jgi:hypothetical protein
MSELLLSAVPDCGLIFTTNGRIAFRQPEAVTLRASGDKDGFEFLSIPHGGLI